MQAKRLAELLHRFQPEAWAKDREELLMLTHSVDPIKISILEASFNVDCHTSVSFQYRVDLFLTGFSATLLFFSGIFLAFSMGLDLLSSNSGWGWELLIVIPLALLVLVPGLLVVTMYLSLIMLPIGAGLRYVMSSVIPSLALVARLRRLRHP
jgi:hypothetical protein